MCDEGAMASNSDLDVEDYYIVKYDNESASSEYVPCLNYPNDKVYPEDEKNGLVRLDEDTGPQIFIDLRVLVETTWIEMNSLQVQFLMIFLKIECGQY